ncbi:hypothetical protein [Chromatium okenii]|jgi:hypothetical protein|uniref:hypothetical protein n=1 Tax=Chromatium okenii TaxID=61644 RepID=UPI0026EA1EFC|nr:hypothetical protein [Chromatium okenii]MBV5310808.1 hypothetical protein [Chromatium okenii]
MSITAQSVIGVRTPESFGASAPHCEWRYFFAHLFCGLMRELQSSPVPCSGSFKLISPPHQFETWCCGFQSKQGYRYA